MSIHDKPQDVVEQQPVTTSSGASAPTGVQFTDAEKLHIQLDARRNATGRYTPHH